MKLFKKKLTDEYIKKHTCPECGENVGYVSSEFAISYIFEKKEKEKARKNYDHNNPYVVCMEMGHWMGQLSDCNKPKILKSKK